MRHSTKFLLILVVLSLSIPLTWLAYRKDLFQRFFAAPFMDELTIDVNERILPMEFSSQAVYEQRVRIAGNTSIPSKVKLLLNENTIGQVDTDSDNGFDFSYVTLRPGTNSLRLTAESVIAWRRLFAVKYLDIRYEPVKPSAPVLLPFPSTVNSPKLEIRGVADPSIRLFVNVEKLSPKPAAELQPEVSPTPEVQEYPTWVSADGRFTQVIDLRQEGAYKISSVARNSKDQASYTSNILEVKYDKGFYPKLQTKKRKTTISIGYRQVKTELEATLPKDDPLVADLITGKLTTTQFVGAVFGYVTINDYFALDDLTPETTPIFSLEDGTTTVKLSSDNEAGFGATLPSFSGPLTIKRFSRPEGPDDTLTLIVKDYRLHSVRPLPSRVSGDEAVWINEDAEHALLEGITAELRSDPSSAPLRVLQVTPDAIPYSWLKKLFRVLSALLGVIPMLWFLWWLKRNREGDQGWASWIDRAPQRLMFWFMVPVVFGQATAFRWKWLEQNLPIDAQFKNEFASLIGTGLVLLVLTFVLYWFRRSNWGSWFFLIFKKLLQAWVIVAVFSALWFGLSYLNVHHYRIVTVAILAPFLIVFLRDAINWTGTMWAEGMNDSMVRFRGRDWIILGLSLLLLHPTDHIYFQIFNSETWVRVQFACQEFFRHIRDLAPYALIPVLFFVLRRIERGKLIASDEAVETSGMIALGGLLFSSYLVGVDTSWFWLPLPFLLSLPVYRRLMLDPKRRAAISEALPQLLSGRAALIRTVRMHASPALMPGALQSLEKKFSSGDLSLKDFKDRAKQIEDYLKSEESESPQVGDIKTKDLLLAVGPCASNWENGWWAVTRSMYIIVPLLLVYLFLFMLKEIGSFHIFFSFWFFTKLVSFVMDGLVGAFFFGFFFNSIRGASGLKKGINISLAIILCLLPSWIAPLSSSSVTNLIGLLFRACQAFLFFTILGVWAFDYKNYRQAVADQFRWNKFVRFGDMPGATAFLSVILTSLGVIVTTVLTGQFTAIVTQLVKAAIPIIPVPGTN